MEIKFKKLSEKAQAPVRGSEGAAGFDLVCTGIDTAWNEVKQLMLVYHTGLAVEIPEGYVGLLFPRSSVCNKSITLTNCVGVIDSDYRGEIKAVFRVTTDVAPAIYKEGERFAQLLIVPIASCEFVEAENLADTARGEGGYGSTGDNVVSAATGSQSLPENEDESTNSETAPEASGGEENIPETAEDARNEAV